MFQRAAVVACVTTALVVTAVPLAAEGEVAFSFAVPNAPKTGLGEDRLQVTIDRWSTDSERDQIAAVLTGNDTATIKYTLRNAEGVGHLRWPGGLDYTLRYARRTSRANGGADVVLVADSRVWIWWDSKMDIALDEPFTVFHIRLDRNGVGEGRIAPGSSVRSDKSAGVAIDNLETRPALIADVRPRTS